MPTTESASYALEVPGLAAAIAGCKPDPKHRNLLNVLQSFEPLRNVKLATSRGDAWLSRRKVIDASGNIISDDHEEWLKQQLAADDGRAGKTHERLKNAGFVLSECGITTLYLVHDRGTADESNFVQVELDLEDEWTNRPLFSEWPYSLPASLRDLIDASGYEFPKDQRKQVREPQYRLRRVIDIKRFVHEAIDLDAARRDDFRKRRYIVEHNVGTSSFTRAESGQSGRNVVSADEAFPGWNDHPAKWGRIFVDWSISSAGRSGARLCDHWAMQTSDYTDPKGERWMSLVPLWTITIKLAEVEGKKGGAYELFGKLEKLDRRVKVPFAWYFFMLHGNRVDDVAGRRVIKAAEAGEIVLPEHDYRVLKTWEAHPYGF